MDVLRRQFLAHIAQTSPSPLLVEVERAEGIYFWSPDGKRYVDLIAGVTVSNLGHSNPAVVEAVCSQARSYMHMMVYGEMVEKPQVKYARRLAENLPGHLQSAYFLNSGAEAVEGALKLAKRFTGRPQLVSFCGAYHGSTHGAMSVMGGELYKNAYRPLLPDVMQLEFNNFDDLQQITERTACVITEPVQSENGVRLPAEGYLAALRKRCDEVGALLIFDEIQTAMGRSGELFAFMKYGVAPDILVLSKAFGGGMPLSAFISSAGIMKTLSLDPPLGHITTFGGHPVCCAAGLAAFEYILENGLWLNAEDIGAIFESRLAGHPAVRQVRRCGLLMAVELGDAGTLARMMRLLTENGYLSDWFLFCDTAFRISPPLTITASQAEECCRDIVFLLDRL